jgi:hypothetical protein
VRGHDPAALAVIPLVEPSIRRKVVLLAGAHLADEHPPAAAIAAHLARACPARSGRWSEGACQRASVLAR